MLTKPSGSLGVLESVSVQLAGIAGECPPPLPEPAVVAVFAADHGVHAQGVTPWPQEVTAQMVANFLASGAVVNAIAAQAGAEVCVVDVGVAADLPSAPGLLPRKVRPGTADMTAGPAMTRAEAERAVETGIETARDLAAAGNRCLLTGDMGIANTTASAALIAVFTGAGPAEVTGRGTGIDDPTLARKVDVVRRALDRHQPDPADPLGVLAAVGGLEHAALAGFILGGAALRLPVVLDGVIACAAALVARAFAAGRDRHPDRRAPVHRAGGAPGAGRARPAPAARPGPAARRGLRRGPGPAGRRGRGPRAAGRRHLRQRRSVRGEIMSRPVQGEPRRAPARGEGTSGLLLRRRSRPERVLVLGGARSGKSVAAERMLADADRVDYVATGAKADSADPDWAAKVRVHQQRRPRRWITIETLDLESVLTGRDLTPADLSTPVLIECLSTWLARVMEHSGLWDGLPGADEEVTRTMDRLVAAWQATSRPVIAVSNEVGSGVVPGTVSGIRFRDELGGLNARIAAESQQVYLCVAGIPQRLK